MGLLVLLRAIDKVLNDFSCTVMFKLKDCFFLISFSHIVMVGFT